MARPKKENPPAKRREINIRFTDELFNVLTKDAAAAGLPRTEYIRRLITNRKPVVKLEVVYTDERILQIFSNLGHYGSNLNQIARHLHQGGEITDEMWKEIQASVSEIFEIRDAVKELVGEYRGSD